MAAQKSTASLHSRNSKTTKRDGKRITDDDLHRLPSLEEVDEHFAKTLTVKHGVLVAGVLVFSSKDSRECRLYRDGRGIGTIIQLDSYETEGKAYANLQEHPEGHRDNIEDRRHPLSVSLRQRFEYAISQIEEACDGEFEISGPYGMSYGESLTEEEAATAHFDPVVHPVELDLRKPLAPQVTKQLKLAEKFAARVRAGEVDLRPVLGHALFVDGNQVCEPTSEHAAVMLEHNRKDRGKTEVKLVFEPAKGKAVQA